MYNYSMVNNLLDKQKKAQRKLAYATGTNYTEWRNDVDKELRKLVGALPETVPLNPVIEYEEDCGTYINRRFTFTTEPDCDVPCHLLLPKNVEKPCPVVVCLQGHSSGMHLSLGVAKYENDEAFVTGERRAAYGLQAVAGGFAALVIEQRCFGERRDDRPKMNRVLTNPCHHMTLNELMLGRTMIGLRVWDVSRALDIVEEFQEVDSERIGCMGASGGGTVTYYAACLDHRIKVAMPACSVCTFSDSIGWHDHCACNYIPNILESFEMSDLSGLIAPRKLVIFTGRDDPIFPLAGVEKAFGEIKKIYSVTGNEDKCELVIGTKGHHFQPGFAWPAFKKISGW